MLYQRWIKITVTWNSWPQPLLILINSPTTKGISGGSIIAKMLTDKLQRFIKPHVTEMDTRIWTFFFKYDKVFAHWRACPLLRICFSGYHFTTAVHTHNKKVLRFRQIQSQYCLGVTIRPGIMAYFWFLMDAIWFWLSRWYAQCISIEANNDMFTTYPIIAFLLNYIPPNSKGRGGSEKKNE